MFRSLAGVILTAMMLGSSASGWAAPPAYTYPEEFTRSGTLDGMGRDHVVINDQRYLLSKNLRVHTPQRSFSVLADVKVGDFVGANVTGEGGGKLGVVEELWVLPNLRPVR